MTCWLCGFETTDLAPNAKAPMCKDGASGCPTCKAVAAVDEEINQALATLRRLLDRRCDLRSEQNRAHDPIHRLPVELRNYVFELVQPRWDEWGDTLEVEGVTPSYLSSICRSWRDIAWLNPSLWSTIRLAPGKMSTSWWVDFVHNRILRSRTLPLIFHFEAVGRSDEDMECSEVLDAMNQCSNRLQSLFLEIPFTSFCAFQRRDFQWHRLTRLQITVSSQLDQSVSLLNPTASPEKVELYFLPFKSLQISWNRLSCATIHSFDLEDLTQLFQHAPQMTDCHLYSLACRPENFSMPPIIHHRLKTLTLRFADWGATPIIRLDSLTFPCLQEFHTNKMIPLMDLPAFVHRSSCPLTRLKYHDYENAWALFDNLQPLLGVNDIFLDWLNKSDVVMKNLLLGEYFPDLRRLTLRPQPFLVLWEMGVIPLLNHKRFRPDGPNEGRIAKLLVVGQDPAEIARIWNSEVGEQLKVLGVSLTEDGFEF